MTEELVERERRRIPVWAKIVAWGVFVLLMAYLGTYGYTWVSLQQVRKDIQSHGLPLAIDEVIPPEVSDTDNAFLVFKKVIHELRTGAASGADIFEEVGAVRRAVGSQVTDEFFKEFGAITSDPAFSNALRYAREMRKQDRWRSDARFSEGPDTLFPYVTDVFNLTHLLAPYAKLQVRVGDSAAAWDTCTTGANLIAVMEQDPVFISQMVRVAGFSTLFNAAEVVTQEGIPDAAQFAQLKKDLAAIDDLTPLATSIEFKRVFYGVPAIQSVRRGERMGYVSDPWPVVYRFFPQLSLDDEVRFNKMMLLAASMCGSPLHDTRVTWDEAAFMESLPPWCQLSVQLGGYFSRAREKYAQMIAQSRVMLAGLAIQQFHSNQDQYPVSLSELGLASTTDPFTGKPLIYRSAADGFVVYSVGIDRNDDGGIHVMKSYKEPHDICWRVGSFYTPFTP